ncbi:MAG: GAF domain-containing protein [Elusimicrobiota bacterium]
MDKCPGCNKIVLSDYSYCPRCGKAFNGSGEEDAAPRPEQCEEDAVKFFNLARNLSTAENIDQLLAKIGRAAENILNSERSSILLLDEKKENLYFKTVTGEDILKKLKVPVSRGVAGWIARNKKPEIVNDPYSDDRFSPETDRKTGYKTKSIAGAPMIVGKELVGVVEVLNKKEGSFTKTDIDNLTGFAGLAAVSILNTRLRAQQENIMSNILDYLVMGSEALSSAEGSSKGHTWEMARMASAMTSELNIDEKKRHKIHRAAMLHDIGFLGLENPRLFGFDIQPDLPPEAKFRLHPVIGSEMIKSIKPLSELYPFIENHHRYRNGEGFPENIGTEALNKETEIIAILEDYLMHKDKDKINFERYSDEIRSAFLTIL